MELEEWTKVELSDEVTSLALDSQRNEVVTHRVQLDYCCTWWYQFSTDDDVTGAPDSLGRYGGAR